MKTKGRWIGEETEATLKRKKSSRSDHGVGGKGVYHNLTVVTSLPLKSRKVVPEAPRYSLDNREG